MHFETAQLVLYTEVHKTLTMSQKNRYGVMHY